MSEDLASKLYHDFPTFAKLCLKIENKEGRLVPFELNDAQQIAWLEIKRQMDAGEPVRIILLKGRQQGCSTLAQGLSMWLACTREGFRSMTVAHKLKPAAQDLFGKVEEMYKSLPPEVKYPIAAGRQTGRRMKFDDPMRSLLVVESAEESDAVGRSGTFAFGHLTEIPFWPKADETVAAFMACVPDKAGTFVIVESTAKGMGDWFHRTWVSCSNAVAEGRRPEFTPVFIPWFKQREYRRKRDELDAPLTDDERKRMKKYGITEEQILWYRSKIEQSGDLAQQEYPDEADLAFLTSGMPFFLPKPMAKLEKRVKETPPLRKGRWVSDVENGKRKFRFREHDTGELWVWESPKKDHQYLVSVDPSTGRGRDSSAYHVLDVTDPVIKQVATFHGKIPVDALATDSILTCRYYNNALWVPERNNHGEGLVAKGVNDIGYTNVYRYKRDAYYGASASNLLGWTTSKSTRPMALEALAEHVHNGLLEINCIRTVKEMRTFIFADDLGLKAEAAKGTSDDLVMSLAIGIAARNQATTGTVSFEVWN